MKKLSLSILIEYVNPTAEDEKCLSEFFSYLERGSSLSPHPDVYRGAGTLLLIREDITEREVYCMLENVLLRAFCFTFCAANRTTSVVFSEYPADCFADFFALSPEVYWNVYFSENSFRKTTGRTISAIRQHCELLKPCVPPGRFSLQVYKERKLRFANAVSGEMSRRRIPKEVYCLQLRKLMELSEEEEEADSGSSVVETGELHNESPSV